MADRRMFTKKVTDDDNFMSLSSSAQALYLHLSMSADDDGFCNQVSTSMFKAHASMQDLQALLEKRYIYQFENGVIVIKHWRMANALRKDRYTPTTFQEELSKLQLKDNGSYTWLPDGCRLVAERLPQDSIDKNSIDKNSINNMCVENTQVSASGSSKNNYSANFEEFWKCYPRRKEKSKAYKCYQTRLKDGFTEEELLRACKAYADECKKKHTEEQYIKLCATFIGPNTPFVDYLKGGDTDGRDNDTNSGKTQTSEGIYDDFAKNYFARRGIPVPKVR